MTRVDDIKIRNFSLLKGWFIACLAFLIYFDTINYGFVLDDSIVLSENEFTQQGVSGWSDLLTTDTFRGFFKDENKAQLVAGGRYRPLSQMFFAFVYEFAGNKPAIYHLFNALAYGVVCWLLFVFLTALFTQRLNKRAKLCAFFASLIFALHPIHTEVVANIKGLDEIFSTGFALLTLLFLTYFQKSKHWKHAILAAVFFFLSLLSKENTITLLLIAPMIWAFSKGTVGVSALKPIGILTASFLLYMALRIQAIGLPFGQDVPIEFMNNPFLKYQDGTLIAMEWQEKLSSILYSQALNIKLLFYPHPLSHDYYPKQIPNVGFGNLTVIVSILFHISLLIYSVIKIRSRSIPALSILFYLISISITSNVLFPVGTNLSERFLFFPSIGFALLIGYLICLLHKKKKLLGLSVVTLISLMFIFKTVTRNPIWKDNFTLFNTDVKHSPNSAKVRNAAAGSIITEFASLPEGEEKDIIMNRALDHLDIALKIHPHYKNAWLLKGNALLYKNDFEEAVEAYKQALKLSPNYHEAMNNLFIAYRQGGRYFGETLQNGTKALTWLKKAHEINSEDIETNRLLGVAYGIQGQHEKAIEYFKILVEKNPKNATFWKLLGTGYHSIGNIEESNKAFEKAQALNPNVFNQ